MRCTLLNPHRSGEWLPGVGQQYADAILGGRRRDCAAAFTQLSCQVQTQYQGLSSVAYAQWIVTRVHSSVRMLG